MSHPERQIPVCGTCRGTDVWADAYAEWQPLSQSWEVVETFDKGGYCTDCQSETRLRWITCEGDEGLVLV